MICNITVQNGLFRTVFQSTAAKLQYYKTNYKWSVSIFCTETKSRDK